MSVHVVVTLPWNYDPSLVVAQLTASFDRVSVVSVVELSSSSWRVLAWNDDDESGCDGSDTVRATISP